MGNRKKRPVTIIIHRSFHGTKTAAEMLVPILAEDIKRLTEDTFDKSDDGEYTERTA